MWTFQGDTGKRKLSCTEIVIVFGQGTYQSFLPDLDLTAQFKQRCMLMTSGVMGSVHYGNKQDGEAKIT